MIDAMIGDRREQCINFPSRRFWVFERYFDHLDPLSGYTMGPNTRFETQDCSFYQQYSRGRSLLVMYLINTDVVGTLQMRYSGPIVTEDQHINEILCNHVGTGRPRLSAMRSASRNEISSCTSPRISRNALCPSSLQRAPSPTR